MFARKGGDSLVLAIFGLVVFLGCVALYGLLVAHRYGFVVILLFLTVVASALINVSLNKETPNDGGLVRGNGLQSQGGKQIAGVGRDFGSDIDRKIILCYQDSTQNSSAIHALSVPVEPGDHLSLIVREGHQGILIKRS